MPQLGDKPCYQWNNPTANYPSGNQEEQREMIVRQFFNDGRPSRKFYTALLRGIHLGRTVFEPSSNLKCCLRTITVDYLSTSANAQIKLIQRTSSIVSLPSRRVRSTIRSRSLWSHFSWNTRLFETPVPYGTPSKMCPQHRFVTDNWHPVIFTIRSQHRHSQQLLRCWSLIPE